MADRLISADALIRHIENQYREWGDEYDALQILGDIEDAPTAEPKHGRWIGVNPMVDTLECSVCGENILGEEFKSNYCPNCGCRMDEVEKDGEERPETHRENA